MKWEYAIVNVGSYGDDKLKERLKTWGEAGWELVSVVVDGEIGLSHVLTNYVLFFKRRHD